MPAKKPVNLADQLIDAFLACVVAQGWADLTLADVARKSRIPLNQWQDLVGDKNGLLGLLARRIDRRMQDDADTQDDNEIEKDRIFSVLMTRFDILEEYRDGICQILDYFRQHPTEALTGLPHLPRSMRAVLDTAGVAADGMGGCIKISGLTVAYIFTLRKWENDQTADLSQTMAALDRALRHYDRWCGSDT